MTRAIRRVRPGFTLVEMLVVLGLILLLLGITLAVSSSGISDSHKTISAGDRVSGWLLNAKTGAAQARLPRGVRFSVGTNGQIKEAQYIEVPQSYAVLPAVTGVPPRLLLMNTQGTGAKRVFIANANTIDLTQSVFGGDVLSLPEFGTLHTVLSVGAGAPVSPPAGLPVGSVEVVVRNPALLPNVPAGTTPTYATTAFGFHRQAQPATGEPVLQLTSETCVDPGLCKPAIGTAAGTTFDVLFAPTGEVLNATGGKVVFWVRDTRLPTPRPASGTDNRTEYEAAGQMVLVVVYTKTGSIATQPVILPTANGVAGHNPYSSTEDAVNTGL